MSRRSASAGKSARVSNRTYISTIGRQSVSENPPHVTHRNARVRP